MTIKLSVNVPQEQLFAGQRGKQQSGFSSTLEQLEAEFSQQAFRALDNPETELADLSQQQATPLHNKSVWDSSNTTSATLKNALFHPHMQYNPAPQELAGVVVCTKSDESPVDPRALSEVRSQPKLFGELLQEESLYGTALLHDARASIDNERRRYRLYAGSNRVGVVAAITPEAISLWNDPDSMAVLGQAAQSVSLDEVVLSGKKLVLNRK